MRRTHFHFELPADLVAQHPLRERAASRLLCLDGASGALSDCQFGDLVDLLHAGDLLVFNDTRVIPARLLGRKATGGRVELLVERILDHQTLLAQVRASKSPKPGSRIHLAEDVAVEVLERRGEFYVLRISGRETLPGVLERLGEIPLPPYIERSATAADRERYQTVYARRPGAVAAPTAGLHFDTNLLEQLAHRGVESAFVTLHVGAGTFQPVRSEDIRDHRMHSEWLELGADTVDAVARTRVRGGRVVAVGTTAVRSLESAMREGTLQPYSGETDIFIYPGYRWGVVDALITNFHLPESTLLMLVCAFGGYRPVMDAYAHAVAAGYRFFSYGDAMFITRNPSPDIP